MIIFDLRCSNGHEFEGWFKNYQDFENQKEKELIGCPICNNTKVEKILSTLSFMSSREKRKKEKEAQEMFVQDLYRFITSSFEDVGVEFARTALKMHYGVEEKRNIRGVTTPEEERILKEEGVEFVKIPMPYDTDETNLN